MLRARGAPSRLTAVGAKAVQQSTENSVRAIHARVGREEHVEELQIKYETSEVASASHGSVREIILNRPNQLNALTHNMVKQLSDRITSHELNPDVTGILLKGSGKKAFCAGGDVVKLHQLGSSGKVHEAMQFFYDEYRLNYMTSRLAKPYVAWMDGITMGGGVGISVHSRTRVATENTMFAMPETAIGFIPDVGGSHFLSRMDNALGMFLALTGHRLKSSDVLHAGIATHFAPSHHYNYLLNAVSNGHERLQTTVEALGTIGDGHNVNDFTLLPHLECIERCFSKDTVEGIMQALEEEQADREFATQTLVTLKKMSPLALKTTHMCVRMGAVMDLDEVLGMEYGVVYQMLHKQDFYEGVGKNLVLKGKQGKPRWEHSRLEDVKLSEVEDLVLGRNHALLSKLKPLDFDGLPNVRGVAYDQIIKNTPFLMNLPKEPMVGEYPYPLYEQPSMSPVWRDSIHYAGVKRPEFVSPTDILGFHSLQGDRVDTGNALYQEWRRGMERRYWSYVLRLKIPETGEDRMARYGEMYEAEKIGGKLMEDLTSFDHHGEGDSPALRKLLELEQLHKYHFLMRDENEEYMETFEKDIEEATTDGDYIHPDDLYLESQNPDLNEQDRATGMSLFQKHYNNEDMDYEGRRTRQLLLSNLQALITEVTDIEKPDKAEANRAPENQLDLEEKIDALCNKINKASNPSLRRRVRDIVLRLIDMRETAVRTLTDQSYDAKKVLLMMSPSIHEVDNMTEKLDKIVNGGSQSEELELASLRPELRDLRNRAIPLYRKILETLTATDPVDEFPDDVDALYHELKREHEEWEAMEKEQAENEYLKIEYPEEPTTSTEDENSPENLEAGLRSDAVHGLRFRKARNEERQRENMVRQEIVEETDDDSFDVSKQSILDVLDAVVSKVGNNDDSKIRALMRTPKAKYSPGDINKERTVIDIAIPKRRDDEDAPSSKDRISRLLNGQLGKITKLYERNRAIATGNSDELNKMMLKPSKESIQLYKRLKGLLQNKMKAMLPELARPKVTTTSSSSSSLPSTLDSVSSSSSSTSSSTTGTSAGAFTHPVVAQAQSEVDEAAKRLVHDLTKTGIAEEDFNTLLNQSTQSQGQVQGSNGQTHYKHSPAFRFLRTRFFNLFRNDFFVTHGYLPEDRKYKQHLVHGGGFRRRPELPPSQPTDLESEDVGFQETMEDRYKQSILYGLGHESKLHGDDEGPFIDAKERLFPQEEKYEGTEPLMTISEMKAEEQYEPTLFETYLEELEAYDSGSGVVEPFESTPQGEMTELIKKHMSNGAPINYPQGGAQTGLLYDYYIKSSTEDSEIDHQLPSSSEEITTSEHEESLHSGPDERPGPLMKEFAMRFSEMIPMPLGYRALIESYDYQRKKDPEGDVIHEDFGVERAWGDSLLLLLLHSMYSDLSKNGLVSDDYRDEFSDFIAQTATTREVYNKYLSTFANVLIRRTAKDVPRSLVPSPFDANAVDQENPLAPLELLETPPGPEKKLDLDLVDPDTLTEAEKRMERDEAIFARYKQHLQRRFNPQEQAVMRAVGPLGLTHGRNDDRLPRGYGYLYRADAQRQRKVRYARMAKLLETLTRGELSVYEENLQQLVLKHGQMDEAMLKKLYGLALNMNSETGTVDVSKSAINHLRSERAKFGLLSESSIDDSAANREQLLKRYAEFQQGYDRNLQIASDLARIRDINAMLADVTRADWAELQIEMLGLIARVIPTLDPVDARKRARSQRLLSEYMGISLTDAMEDRMTLQYLYTNAINRCDVQAANMYARAAAKIPIESLGGIQAKSMIGLWVDMPLVTTLDVEQENKKVFVKSLDERVNALVGQGSGDESAKVHYVSEDAKSVVIARLEKQLGIDDTKIEVNPNDPTDLILNTEADADAVRQREPSMDDVIVETGLTRREMLELEGKEIASALNSITESHYIKHAKRVEALRWKLNKSKRPAEYLEIITSAPGTQMDKWEAAMKYLEPKLTAGLDANIDDRTIIDRIRKDTRERALMYRQLVNTAIDPERPPQMPVVPATKHALAMLKDVATIQQLLGKISRKEPISEYILGRVKEVIERRRAINDSIKNNVVYRKLELEAKIRKDVSYAVSTSHKTEEQAMEEAMSTLSPTERSLLMTEVTSTANFIYGEYDELDVMDDVLLGTWGGDRQRGRLNSDEQAPVDDSNNAEQAGKILSIAQENVMRRTGEDTRTARNIDDFFSMAGRPIYLPSEAAELMLKLSQPPEHILTSDAPASDFEKRRLERGTVSPKDDIERAKTPKGTTPTVKGLQDLTQVPAGFAPLPIDITSSITPGTSEGIVKVPAEEGAERGFGITGKEVTNSAIKRIGDRIVVAQGNVEKEDIDVIAAKAKNVRFSEYEYDREVHVQTTEVKDVDITAINGRIVDPVEGELMRREQPRMYPQWLHAMERSGKVAYTVTKTDTEGNAVHYMSGRAQDFNQEGRVATEVYNQQSKLLQLAEQEGYVGIISGQPTTSAPSSSQGSSQSGSVVSGVAGGNGESDADLNVPMGDLVTAAINSTQPVLVHGAPVPLPGEYEVDGVFHVEHDIDITKPRVLVDQKVQDELDYLSKGVDTSIEHDLYQRPVTAKDLHFPMSKRIQVHSRGGDAVDPFASLKVPSIATEAAKSLSGPTEFYDEDMFMSINEVVGMKEMTKKVRSLERTEASHVFGHAHPVDMLMKQGDDETRTFQFSIDETGEEFMRGRQSIRNVTATSEDGSSSSVGGINIIDVTSTTLGTAEDKPKVSTEEAVAEVNNFAKGQTEETRRRFGGFTTHPSYLNTEDDTNVNKLYTSPSSSSSTFASKLEDMARNRNTSNIARMAEDGSLLSAPKDKVNVAATAAANKSQALELLKNVEKYLYDNRLVHTGSLRQVFNLYNIHDRNLGTGFYSGGVGLSARSRDIVTKMVDTGREQAAAKCEKLLSLVDDIGKAVGVDASKAMEGATNKAPKESLDDLKKMIEALGEQTVNDLVKYVNSVKSLSAKETKLEEAAHNALSRHGASSTGIPQVDALSATMTMKKMDSAIDDPVFQSQLTSLTGPVINHPSEFVKTKVEAHIKPATYTVVPDQVDPGLTDMHRALKLVGDVAEDALEAVEEDIQERDDVEVGEEFDRVIFDPVTGQPSAVATMQNELATKENELMPWQDVSDQADLAEMMGSSDSGEDSGDFYPMKGVDDTDLEEFLGADLEVGLDDESIYVAQPDDTAEMLVLKQAIRKTRQTIRDQHMTTVGYKRYVEDFDGSDRLDSDGDEVITVPDRKAGSFLSDDDLYSDDSSDDVPAYRHGKGITLHTIGESKKVEEPPSEESEMDIPEMEVPPEVAAAKQAELRELLKAKAEKEAELKRLQRDKLLAERKELVKIHKDYAMAQARYCVKVLRSINMIEKELSERIADPTKSTGDNLVINPVERAASAARDAAAKASALQANIETLKSTLAESLREVSYYNGEAVDAESKEDEALAAKLADAWTTKGVEYGLNLAESPSQTLQVQTAAPSTQTGEVTLKDVLAMIEKEEDAPLYNLPPALAPPVETSSSPSFDNVDLSKILDTNSSIMGNDATSTSLADTLRLAQVVLRFIENATGCSGSVEQTLRYLSTAVNTQPGGSQERVESDLNVGKKIEEEVKRLHEIAKNPEARSKAGPNEVVDLNKLHPRVLDALNVYSARTKIDDRMTENDVESALSKEFTKTEAEKLRQVIDLVKQPENVVVEAITNPSEPTLPSQDTSDVAGAALVANLPNSGKAVSRGVAPGSPTSVNAFVNPDVEVKRTILENVDNNGDAFSQLTKEQRQALIDAVTWVRAREKVIAQEKIKSAPSSFPSTSDTTTTQATGSSSSTGSVAPSSSSSSSSSSSPALIHPRLMVPVKTREELLSMSLHDRLNYLSTVAYRGQLATDRNTSLVSVRGADHGLHASRHVDIATHTLSDGSASVDLPGFVDAKVVHPNGNPDGTRDAQVPVIQAYSGSMEMPHLAAAVIPNYTPNPAKDSEENRIQIDNYGRIRVLEKEGKTGNSEDDPLKQLDGWTPKSSIELIMEDQHKLLMDTSIFSLISMLKEDYNVDFLMNLDSEDRVVLMKALRIRYDAEGKIVPDLDLINKHRIREGQEPLTEAPRAFLGQKDTLGVDEMGRATTGVAYDHARLASQSVDMLDQIETDTALGQDDPNDWTREDDMAMFPNEPPGQRFAKRTKEELSLLQFYRYLGVDPSPATSTGMAPQYDLFLHSDLAPTYTGRDVLLATKGDDGEYLADDIDNHDVKGLAIRKILKKKEKMMKQIKAKMIKTKRELRLQAERDAVNGKANDTEGNASENGVSSSEVDDKLVKLLKEEAKKMALTLQETDDESEKLILSGGRVGPHRPTDKPLLNTYNPDDANYKEGEILSKLAGEDDLEDNSDWSDDAYEEVWTESPLAQKLVSKETGLLTADLIEKLNDPNYDGTEELREQLKQHYGVREHPDAFAKTTHAASPCIAPTLL